jgi:hypothetical protein
MPGPIHIYSLEGTGYWRLGVLGALIPLLGLLCAAVFIRGIQRSPVFIAVTIPPRLGPTKHSSA